MARAARPDAWLLLIHQIPPRPLYLRAKIRQQLARIGAVPLKKSVYALPDRPDCVEDFQWLAQEVETGGGEAFVCRAEFLESGTADLLRVRSREERDAEYGALAEEVGRSAAASPDSQARTAAIARHRARWNEIRRIDFFDAGTGPKTERTIEEAAMRPPRAGSRRESPASRSTRSSSNPSHPRLAGKVWVTRPGVKVDRMASAWFVRRFVDAKARFRFDAPSRKPRPGEVFFDVAGGDFTHEGDHCTLETLLVRTGARDAALAHVAEIVHDIDLKDGKFGRLEAPGIAQLVAGVVESTSDDAERLRSGFALFDQLYGGLSAPGAGASRSKGKSRAKPKTRKRR